MLKELEQHLPSRLPADASPEVRERFLSQFAQDLQRQALVSELERESLDTNNDKSLINVSQFSCGWTLARRTERISATPTTSQPDDHEDRFNGITANATTRHRRDPCR
jgi:hypothetical protein